MSRRRIARLLVASLAAAAAAAALSACGSPAPAAVDPPLSSGAVVGSQGWAVLAMGQLGVVDDTFYELLVRAGARWRLVTPPDAATNGGVVVAPDAVSAVAGVLPSNNLRFSPLATTADGGRQWTSGVLPAGLVPAPDALATLPGGRVLALLAEAGGTLVEGTRVLGGWRPVLRRAGLAAATAASGCRFTAVTAVATSADGSVLLGGACHARAAGPVVELVAGHPRSLGLRIGLDVDERVLRLGATATSTVALVATTLGGPALVAAWRSDRAWSTSAPLALRGDTLVSSSIGPGGDVVVVVRGARGLLAYVARGSGLWAQLPALPAGTQDVVPWGSGYQALAVHGAHLTVYASHAGSGWSVVQRMLVPIAYGSTS